MAEGRFRVVSMMTPVESDSCATVGGIKVPGQISDLPHVQNRESQVAQQAGSYRYIH